MKRKLQKYKTILPKTYKYLFDFIIVFTGVFMAFWLSGRKDEYNKESRRQEIYIAIYEDLNSFYESGTRNNEKGFVIFFESLEKKSDSLIAIKKLQPRANLYGDYWKVPIINSLIQGGILQDIDISTFKKVTRFNTLHQNLLRTIEDYNTFYDKYITANYDQGIDFYFKTGTNELKPKYSYLNGAMEEIAYFSELLVNIARDLSLEIKEKHIK